MTVLELATWASKNSVDFQDIGVINVEEDETAYITGEYFKSEPIDGEIKPGHYLYYYASNYAFFIDVVRDGKEMALIPDYELDFADCDDHVYLYRLDA